MNYAVYIEFKVIIRIIELYYIYLAYNCCLQLLDISDWDNKVYFQQKKRLYSL